MTVRSRPPRFRSPMPTPRPPVSSSWLGYLDIAVVLVWGVLLLKYQVTGEIYFLLHPDYMWLATSAGVGLLGLGGFLIWQALPASRFSSRRSPLANVQHISLFPRSFSCLLLITVGVLGLVITPRPFASEIALQRGVTDTLTMTRSQPQAFRATNRPEERSLIEWVRTLNVYPEPDAYAGQRANVQGFVIHPNELPNDYLMISRFIITCCAADAYPVGLPVKLPKDRSAYPPDLWFQVQGEMMTETLNGQRQLVIKATSLEEIPEPRNPYDY
ncbi:MAG: TIGR03943 family protein [Synechococcales bacterium]|nr:TIGR03943 family protein [Synechococcales bacterium]